MHTPSNSRYDSMIYNRCGNSGLKLPAISLGLWHNFGQGDDQAQASEMIVGAFDLGINHFDLANNYGPPAGSAEVTFGKVMAKDLVGYRDELIVSSKAGYDMWPGPYGEWGSRKYLIASADQSLKRTGLDYFDIFYSHRFDPNTPLEETMGALDQLVRSGKALYVGISSYSAAKTIEAYEILNKLGTPCLIHQPSYSILNRWIEKDLLDTLQNKGIGAIAFSPLAQGMLSGRYLQGIPADSRAGKPNTALNPTALSANIVAALGELNDIAKTRNQTLAQMAISWVLKDPRVTSALIGASSLGQIKQCVSALENLKFANSELVAIDAFAEIANVNLWHTSSEN